MAVRLPSDVLWRRSAGHANGLRLGRQSSLSFIPPRASTSRLRSFSSQGSPILCNNVAASTSSSTALESIPLQGSGSGISSNGGIAMLEPYVQYIDQLPQLLHLPPSAHSYAISIVILTVVVRTCVTLPVSLWQRARMRRMEVFVAPRWEQLKKELPVIVAKRSRREKKSYEEYEKELKKELKLQIRTLTKKYNCSPSLSIAVPLLVHLPLFIAFTLLLRTSLLVSGSPISLETIPWWAPPAELQAKFDAGARILAERGIEGEALKMLSTMQGPTLAEIDKTMLGPIGLGMLTMTNVELGQWVRRGMKSEKEIKKKQEEKVESRRIKGNDKSDPIPQGVDMTMSPIQRTNVIGNSLRALAIGFVAVSSQAPTGVVIYWLTSTGYTLAQNMIFALLDRRRMAAKKRIG